MKKYTLKGTLTSNIPTNFQALIVEAWDKDVTNNDLLGRVNCQNDGQFEIHFDNSAFQDHPIDHAPDVFFKVYRGNKLLLSTEKKPLKNIESTLIDDIVLNIEEETSSVQIKDWAVLSGLDETKATLLNSYFLDNQLELSSNSIADLIDKQELTQDQGDRLNFVATLSNATGFNTKIINKLRGTSFTELGNNRPSKLVDLVALDYVTLLDNFKTETTEEEVLSPEIMAHRVLAEVESNFPTERLKTQLKPSKEDLQHVLTNTNDSGVLGKRTAFVNSYKHLGIATILDNNTLDIDTKIEQIETKVGLIDHFLESNTGFNILSADLTKNGLDHYNFEAFAPLDQQAIVKTLQGFQRVMHLAPNSSVAKNLLAAGYDSAFDVAEQPFETFLEASQLDIAMAESVYELAKTTNGQIANTIINIKERLIDAMPISVLDDNFTPNKDELLAELDDYKDFFGNQNFCSCKHCSSIFSPAAYFVDLMDFVQNSITKTNFQGNLSSHFLNLKNRRPDLWELSLTCENTNTPIPYLEIINEVLESYLLKRRNWANKEAIYEALSRTIHSFNQPFNLPLAQLKEYLNHFQLSINDVVETMSSDGNASIYTLIAISEQEAQIITTPNTNLDFLTRLYGSKIETTTLVDVQDLLSTMGVNRSQLGKLLSTKFVQQGNNKPSIKQGKEPADSLQFNIEYALNLSPSVQDRLHRFTRLWKAIGWEIELLDFVVEQLGFELEPIAQIIRLHQDLKSPSIEHSVGLLGQLTDKLFDKTFNLPYFVQVEGKLPNNNKLLHPALQTTNATIQNPMVHRLLAALQVNDSDFLHLLKQLDGSLGMSAADPSFLLNKNNLILLFQETTLSRYLGLSMEDYIYLKAILGIQDLRQDSLNKLHQIIKAKAAIQASELSIKEWHESLLSPSSFEAPVALWLEQFFNTLDTQKIDLTTSLNLKDLLYALLPELLLIEGASLAILVDLLGISIDENALSTAIQNKDKNAAVFSFLKKLVPWQFLIKKLALTDVDLLFIKENAALFDLDASSNLASRLNHTALIRLNTYVQQPHQTPTKVNLHNSLISLTSNWNNVLTELAVLTEKTEAQLKLTLQYIQLPSNAIEALDYLIQVLKLSTKLGINAQSLSLMHQTDYSSLKLAAQAIIASFNTKYNKDRVEELETPIKDALLEARRAALSDYLIHSIHPEFKDHQDLYYYFLLDTELSGCARSSRIVAANASLQLYVQRIIMNLERDQGNKILIRLSLNDKKEWQWRKNYRVWEANRKVFLYPENYILPELRDNKTEAFISLEKELQQQSITNESASNSYLRYLETVSTLAKLKIAGTYRYQDTLYLIGKTNSETPEWYYRTFDIVSQSFTSWLKIDASISAKYVSPIIYLGTLYVFWYEISTQSVSEVTNGTSTFKGYKHKVSINYTCIKTDGSWQRTEKIPFPVLNAYHGDEVGIVGDLMEQTIQGGTNNPTTTPSFRFSPYDTKKINNTYTLQSTTWNRLYLSIEDNKLYLFVDQKYLELNLLNNQAKLVVRPSNERIYNPLYLTHNDFQFKWKKIYWVYQSEIYYEAYHNRIYSSAGNYNSGDYTNEKPEIHPINGWTTAFILIYRNNSYLCYYKKSGNSNVRSGYVQVKLDSNLPSFYKESLFNDGLDYLLSLKNQQETSDTNTSEITYNVEYNPKYNFILTPNSKYSPKNSFGAYFTELFFHIPFLIANNLHANQKFEAADQWYRYIFDPTAVETRSEEKEIFYYPYDRVWQYLGFLNKDIESLADIFQNSTAIDLYKKDPFNPHAIARFRMNAYQKTIVMRYIDNLLDWGDHYFAMDTMESINEATLLYMMAYDVLGKRPVEIGACESAKGEGAKYKKIEGSNGFLKQLETYYLKISVTRFSNNSNTIDTFSLMNTTKKSYPVSTSLMDSSSRAIGFLKTEETYKSANYTKNWTYHPNGTLKKQSSPKSKSQANIDIQTKAKTELDNANVLPGTIYTMATKYIQAFCVPNNKHLMKYWDHVEDRLYKIRNCMNIDGLQRQLALFQPPINPMLLVHARAAGLSLQDVLMASGGQNKVLYRFSYLIEKAKGFTNKVQALGSLLMGAIEKRDAEKLTLIRSEQQQQLQQMATLSRENQIAELQILEDSLTIEQNELNFKIAHYDGLIDQDISALEFTEFLLQYASGITLGAEQTFRIVSAIMHLIPNVGSPFAMTYGGDEIGSNANAISDGLRSLAGVFGTSAGIVGQHASYERRLQGWKYQRNLLNFDKQGLEKQIVINKIRQNTAKRALEIQEREIRYNDEVYNFVKDKFGNEKLYSWLVTELQSMYRSYYKMATEYAQMAEAAYHFERDQDNTVYIQNNNWNNQYAGLMAGQNLLFQLDQMEQAYITNTERSMEIKQSFSLRLTNPQELLKLQKTGTCTISLPEVLFDLTYPGQFNRRIRSVTVTIPSVTGPYTNTNATFSLLESRIRKSKNSTLDPMLNGKNNSVVLSSGESDGGLLFTDFHSNKYLPFEGAGAISKWSLELPDKFRSFDYNTISDVILTVAYTAKYDAVYKTTVENNLASQLIDMVKNKGIAQYVNVKQHFSALFRQLLLNPTHQISFDLNHQFFPYYLQDKLEFIRTMQVAILIEKTTTSTWNNMPLSLIVNDNNSNVFDLSTPSNIIGTNLGQFNFNGLLDQSPLRNWSLKLTNSDSNTPIDTLIKNIHIVVYSKLIP